MTLILGCLILTVRTVAATVTIPTATVGSYINWNDAILEKARVEQNGAQIGSTYEGTTATFTLQNETEQDYVLCFKSGAKGLTAVVTWTITDGNGYSVTKQFDISNVGSWTISEYHEGTFEAVPAGELTLTFKVESTTGTYAGNYGALAIHTTKQLYADPEETVPGGIDLSLGSYSNCQMESGGNVGYVRDGATATYNFTVTKAGPYNFSWNITYYNPSTVTVEIQNYHTGDVELSKTFDIPQLSNYASDIHELGELTAGAKKMVLRFTCESGYAVNYKNLALRYAGSDISYYSFKLNVEGGRENLVQMTASPASLDGKYEEGTLITLKAADNTLMHFQHWADGLTETTRQYKMTADIEETATYTVTEGYLAGWDFTVDNQHFADYAEREENKSASIYIKEVDGDGSRTGWIRDQSIRIWTEGEWDFVVRVNARNYKDISVQSLVTFGYNIWPTTQLQCSIDGEIWTDIDGASLTMTADDRNKWKPLNATLPAFCNHAETLYIRWASQRVRKTDGSYDTSVLIGSESNIRSLQLDEIYILGTYELYNDTEAPVLTYITPAQNSQNVKSGGVITLNFNKNVVIDGTAFLGGLPLTGTVFGSRITFPYSALNYDTNYTFTLSADAVKNENGVSLADDISLTFKTVARPTVNEKHGFDFVIGVDGTADEAIAAANAQNSDRYYIFVPNGEWKLEGNDGHNQTKVNKTVSIIGQSREQAVLYNDAEEAGISDTHTLQLQKEHCYLQDITLRNWRGHGSVWKGVAPALSERGYNVYKNVEIWSNQDTYVSGGTNYWEDGRICGSVDYICGGGNIWFEGVQLLNTRNGSVITAPAQSANDKWGYVFNNCVIDAYYTNETVTEELNSVCLDGGYDLGRPWNVVPRATFLNTICNILPSSAAWRAMGTNLPFHFNEFGSVSENGTLLDLSGRNVSNIDQSNPDCDTNPVMTQEEAAAFRMDDVMGDGFTPTRYTEQCVAPTVTANANVLTWTDDPYALCYVIFRDGQYEANVTTNRYVASTDGNYTVRAANERGGLGEASAVVPVTIGDVTFHTLTIVCDDAQGKVTASPEADENGKYVYGKDITLKAEPVIGYSFRDWTIGEGDGVQTVTDNPCMLTITSDTSVTANFVEATADYVIPAVEKLDLTKAVFSDGGDNHLRNNKGRISLDNMRKGQSASFLVKKVGNGDLKATMETSTTQDNVVLNFRFTDKYNNVSEFRGSVVNNNSWTSWSETLDIPVCGLAEGYYRLDIVFECADNYTVNVSNIVIGDAIASGIGMVDGSQFSARGSDAVYNLSGQRVQRVNNKGIYITKGKKIVKK